MSGEAPAARPGFRTLGILLAVAIVIAAVVVLLVHHRRGERLRAQLAARNAALADGPRVLVAPARLLPGAREVTLPGEARAFAQTTLYAKVSGYVKSIRVDKGDHVRAGQVLGMLESPEVDQQVAAAVSDLEIKRRTFERYRTLVGKDYVSRQDFETVRAQYEVSRAALKQVRALQDYEVLRAPFAGTVTGRYVDAGALIPAATAATSGALPFVDLADLSRLRVTLFVQQDAAAFVRVGDPATIVDPRRPQMKIDAAVSLFSSALDPRSRTMLCEIWIDNRYQLYPGTFVNVTLHLHAPPLPVVPSTALLLRNNRNVVAVVRDQHVRMVPVEIGIDDGKTVQIASGLRPGELVALNLPSEVDDGGPVRPMPATGAGPEGPPGAPPGEPRQGRGARPARPRGE
jgi:RND family efflux transporter MFP subunit